MKSKLISPKNAFDIVLLIAIGVGAIAVIAAFFVDIELVPIVASVAASVFSVAAVLGTYMTVQEMRIDRIERNRPFILVEFPFSASSVIYFVIRNTGTSIARNVRFLFSPSPIDVRGVVFSDLPIFQSPIPVIGPGSEHKSLFHVSHQLLNGDYPKNIEVQVQYEGELGELYSNTFNFDFEQYKELILPPKSIEECLEDISKELKQITKAVESKR